MSFQVSQERDVLRARPILTIALVGLVVTVLSVLAASALLGHGGTTGRLVSASPIQEQGVVEQTPTPASDRGMRVRREGAARRDSYGWVDRSRGIVRVPIARAFDLYLEADGGTR